MIGQTQFPWKNFLFLAAYSIAMGLAEAAIVIYLRELFYPEGFCFPIKLIPAKIAIVEISREAATVIMLLSVGWFSGKRFLTRFAGFIMAFAIWDIFYYVFLKIALDWPATLLDWDILFLIPLPWIGPVLAPVLVSIAFIGAGVAIWHFEAIARPLNFIKIEWILILLAGAVILITFLTNVKTVAQQQMPHPFWWIFFTAGLILGCAAFVRGVRRNLSQTE